MEQENPITCGNCGTENQPGAQYCSECGEPLTRSAGGAVREREEAQTEDGFFGVDDGDDDDGISGRGS